MPLVRFALVGPDCFRTLSGIALRQGRPFATDDKAIHNPSLSLMKHLARRFFPKRESRRAGESYLDGAIQRN